MFRPPAKPSSASQAAIATTPHSQHTQRTDHHAITPGATPPPPRQKQQHRPAAKYLPRPPGRPVVREHTHSPLLPRWPHAPGHAGGQLRRAGGLRGCGSGAGAGGCCAVLHHQHYKRVGDGARLAGVPGAGARCAARAPASRAARYCAARRHRRGAHRGAHERLPWSGCGCGHLSEEGNVHRDRRIVAVVAFFAGAIAGGWLERSKGGMLAWKAAKTGAR
ncbi:hypothetical protein F5883DRAFT_534960 [Diaporthe sp. PMI_573]|nr:hypothetical protein F5883DRAFT_534960 [Diaporthaceae sp. PMI_573]